MRTARHNQRFTQESMMVTVLTGGTGGAKFVWGLAQIIPADQLTVIVNSGDDLRWWGLHVSPDVDSVLYAIAAKLNPERGWGYADDSFRCLERMRSLGADGWFQLGDLDLATHLHRTELLNQGRTLSEATGELATAMGVNVKVIPMSDDRVETRVVTPKGELSFQEYFVRDRYQPDVLDVKFEGAAQAHSAPGVLESIARADIVFIAPSNPVTSIGPILAVPGVREVLGTCTAPVVAVSPIVGGDAVTGPAARLMRMRGWEVSPAGIGEAYRDFVDVVIADTRDQSSVAHNLPFRIAFSNTIMRSDSDKTALARFALEVTATQEAIR
jgi:LPPG:FO 2-phospho-L-lactate transferase